MKKIEKGLVVSCQALENEPLHSSYIMSRMAFAAKDGGAKGIRANTIEDIKEIKKTVDLPIIGIIKKDYKGSEVYITPTYKEVKSLAECQIEIIAMDGTFHKRPKQTLEEIVKKCREEYPNIKLMADIATLEEAKYCEKLGFDFIGTTLYGYTKETQGFDISEDDFIHLKKIIKEVKKPVIAEGKIDTPEKAKRVLELGAYCVVVGGAITRPQEITKKFIIKMNEVE